MTEHDANRPATAASERDAEQTDERDAEQTAVPDNPADLPIGQDVPRGMEGVAPDVGPHGERVVHPPAVAPGDERLAPADQPAEASEEDVSENPAVNEEPPG